MKTYTAIVRFTNEDGTRLALAVNAIQAKDEAEASEKARQRVEAKGGTEVEIRKVRRTDVGI